MKIFKSPQKVLILFLSVLIVISFFMIVRLEGKAASLQSQWEDHQKSLKQNEDILTHLKNFQRMVNLNAIHLDDNSISLFTPKSALSIEDKTVKLSSGGDIEIGPNTNKTLGYSESEDYVYMLHNGSRIILGQLAFKSGKEQGISLISKTNGPKLSVVGNGIVLRVPDKQGDYRILMSPTHDHIKIAKDESIIKFTGDNIDIEAKGDIRLGPTKDKYLGYSSKEDEIQIHQAGSTISFGECYDGKTLVGNGIKIQGKNNGPRLFVTEKNIRMQIPSQKGSYDITLDPSGGFLGLRCGESFVILEKDNIDIKAKGDINIKSLNGNVNINGKKVSLNE
jgi:hypothetical protein